MPEIGAIDPSELAFTEITNVFQRYISRQGNRIDPDGIACKQHAMHLLESLEKRTNVSRFAYGKVTKANPEGDNLKHKGGGVYNFHYFVIATIGEDRYVLDPYLANRIDIPIRYETYLETAYENPEAVIFSTPQIPQNSRRTILY
ncbi:MAG: hypothetical protein QY330_04155 [Candidatus Dojkabacteria bacterium]|uniref:Uncharacterized protein n=2 Tax=Candidatus Dojkabacteria TaxID=74243 RepID=A0A136KIU1_9BACT|nr:MAG: hypothetical protein UZ20_WS6002000581 [candidate division WS6 bacterium OLB21]MBW7954003.1 hypothetical protein [Candidatus Dojkabacteria bacterium]WKZ27715.1 MAG: hypothetical protein QY330_04155 [Candidatus Dojkabacteria bacterium]